MCPGIVKSKYKHHHLQLDNVPGVSHSLVPGLVVVLHAGLHVGVEKIGHLHYYCNRSLTELSLPGTSACRRRYQPRSPSRR